MTREERNALLADLRAANVQEAHFHVGELEFVQFFPERHAPPPTQERPLPKRVRTEDERLFGPLRIGEGQPKPGGEG